MCKPGMQFVVYAKRKSEAGGTVWTRAGEARVAPDGSIHVQLETVPLDGKVHLRAPSAASPNSSEAS